MTALNTLLRAAGLTLALTIGAQACDNAPDVLDVTSSIAVNGTEMFTMCLNGGDMAYVDLAAHSGADIGIWIWNENDEMVAEGPEYGTFKQVEFFADFTGTYRIYLYNNGAAYDEDEMVSPFTLDVSKVGSEF